MDVKDAHKELLSRAMEELLFLSQDYSIAELGDVFVRLSKYFQALAICHLLENLDIKQFRECLIRSGYARRYFLIKSRAEGNVKDKFLAIARTEAFLDSLVAGHLRLAKEIADLSLERWEPSWEYEDDFCYFYFLHGILKDNGSLIRKEHQEIVARFEHALEGGESARLEVCKAFLSRDKSAFILAFSNLLEEKQTKDEVKRQEMLEPEPSTYVFWPRSFVFIEGLALLRLADLVGIQIDEEFPLCPTVGRLSVTNQDCRDYFKEIDQVKLASGKSLGSE